MLQTEFYHEFQANLFFQLYADPMKRHVNFHILTNDMIQIEWIYKRDCQQEDATLSLPSPIPVRYVERKEKEKYTIVKKRKRIKWWRVENFDTVPYGF